MWWSKRLAKACIYRKSNANNNNKKLMINSQLIQVASISKPGCLIKTVNVWCFFVVLFFTFYPEALINTYWKWNRCYDGPHNFLGLLCSFIVSYRVVGSFIVVFSRIVSCSDLSSNHLSPRSWH